MSVIQSEVTHGSRHVAGNAIARPRVIYLRAPDRNHLARAPTECYLAPARVAKEVPLLEPARLFQAGRKTLSVAKLRPGRPHTLLPAQEREIRAWHRARKALGTGPQKAKQMNISTGLLWHIVSATNWRSK